MDNNWFCLIHQDEWYLTCDRESRVCWRPSHGTALRFWSVRSWQWWCPDPVSGNPGSRRAPPAAPWWTCPKPSACCSRAARRRLILRHTHIDNIRSWPLTGPHDLPSTSSTHSRCHHPRSRSYAALFRFSSAAWIDDPWWSCLLSWLLLRWFWRVCCQKQWQSESWSVL